MLIRLINIINYYLLGKNLCNCCGKNINEFDWIGIDEEVLKKYNVVGAGRRKASCPSCGTYDRERLYLEYFRSFTDLFDDKICKSVLHFAPETHLYRILSNQDKVDYTGADLNPEIYQGLKVENQDLMNLSYPSDSFDWIICNHVLEHLLDDRKGLNEIFRVLRIGGKALLQVPIALSLAETFESSNIESPKQRLKYYGQQDHERLYGMDYSELLRSVGFKLHLFDPICHISNRKIKMLGINPKEILFVVEK